MAKYEGTVEAFRYTPESDLAENSIVQVGALVGVTRSSCEANKPIMAFMAGKSSIYSLPLASGLGANVTRGTLATVDSSSNVKPAYAGDSIVGVFWEGAATTDAEAIIMLAPYTLANGSAAATTSAAGLMSAADKTKLDGIGIATSTTAGLVKPDGTSITVTSDGTIAVPGE